MIKDLILNGSEKIMSKNGFDPETRKAYINASEAGRCVRYQYFLKREESPIKTNGFMKRGHVGEEYIIKCLKQAGAKLKYVGEKQQTITDENNKISGTPDGYIWLNDEWVSLEIKTLDPRTNKLKLPNTKHIHQLQICMELAHLQPHNVKKQYPKPKYGILIYIDASDFDDIDIFLVNRNRGVYEDCIKRTGPVLNGSIGDLNREGRFTGECSENDGCPYSGPCGITNVNTTPENNIGLEKLKEILRAYDQAKEQSDSIAKQLATYKEFVIQYMEQRDVKRLKTTSHDLSLIYQSGGTTYDTKSMLTDGLDIDRYKKTGKSYVKLLVKQKA